MESLSSTHSSQKPDAFIPHEAIVNKGSEQLILPGEILFDEGEPSKGIYFIESGKIATKRLNAQGEEQIINIHTQGEILGIRASLQQNSMDKMAYALEKTVLIHMPHDAFMDTLADSYDFTFYISKNLEKNLKEIESRATMLLQRPAAERLAYTFLMFQKKFGEKDGFLDIVLPIKDYARLIGATRTTVYRLFKSFCENKWISCDRSNHIRICNRDALQQFFNMPI